MKKKDLTANPYRTAAHRVAEQVAQITGAECRAVVPGTFSAAAALPVTTVCCPRALACMPRN